MKCDEVEEEVCDEKSRSDCATVNDLVLEEVCNTEAQEEEVCNEIEVEECEDANDAEGVNGVTENVLMKDCTETIEEVCETKEQDVCKNVNELKGNVVTEEECEEVIEKVCQQNGIENLGNYCSEVEETVCEVVNKEICRQVRNCKTSTANLKYALHLRLYICTKVKFLVMDVLIDLNNGMP